jgi:hypothetical protein
MTKDASFKNVVRCHAEETGQRYTEALTDLEGLGARTNHEPALAGVVLRGVRSARVRQAVDAEWTGRHTRPS